MSDQGFRYDLMIEDALLGVVRRIMRQAEARGLPGDHHFYITFRTGHPGTDIPAVLLERYPDEMTIVLQYQFWNLEVHDDRFEVMLSFSERRERLVIPFAAVTAFADPSVKFGLTFKVSDASPPEDDDDTGGENPGEVISLDHFRRKR
ncbi:MAG: ClpXP protease specificity-enhancing factor SspB [Alphaproteobacteria bacterium]|nr:ClpXP protease specificity-enhancing factor SspB [Alphaproteobacteria bacterium]